MNRATEVPVRTGVEPLPSLSASTPMGFAPTVWAHWKKVAHAVGVVQTRILMVIFYFIVMWNDLFIPMVLLQRMDLRTVMVALAGLIARYTGDPPYQFAGLLLSAVPALLVYVIFQQYIIKGLTAGAIK